MGRACRAGTREPRPGDADYNAAHSYCALATIARRQNDPNVTAADVTDVRERNLLMLPSTLTEDLLDVPAHDYRRGIGRPAIPLRDAISVPRRAAARHAGGAPAGRRRRRPLLGGDAVRWCRRTDLVLQEVDSGGNGVAHIYGAQLDTANPGGGSRRSRS